MTRLRYDDISHISEQLTKYDSDLRRIIDMGLNELGAAAAGANLTELQKYIKGECVGIVPITSGEGIINSFSQTIKSIIDFTGLTSFITNATDVAGIAEAVERKATMLFIADDATCTLLHLKKNIIADNSECTSRGFATALKNKIKNSDKKKITILGAGPVGQMAAKNLKADDIEIIIYDIDKEKMDTAANNLGIGTAKSLQEALDKSNFYFEATTSINTIKENDIKADTFIAAPGVPLGIDETVIKKHADRIITDTLEIGVITMVFTILEKLSIM